MTAIPKKQKKEEKKDMRHIIVNHVDNLKPDLLWVASKTMEKESF